MDTSIIESMCSAFLNSARLPEEIRDGVNSSFDAIRKLHVLFALPRNIPVFMENMTSPSTSVSRSRQLFNTGAQHFSENNYIEAEQHCGLAVTVLVPIVSAEIGNDDIGTHTDMCYEIVFEIIKCGILLGDLHILEDFLDFYASLPARQNSTNHNELMNVINRSPLRTARRKHALSCLQKHRLCSGRSEENIEGNGSPVDDSPSSLQPDVSLPMCRQLLEEGKSFLQFEEISEALECFRSIAHIAEAAMKEGVHLPGFGADEEFDVRGLVAKCLILLGDYRRVDSALRQPGGLPLSDHEIRLLILKSDAPFIWKQSMLAVFKNFLRCQELCPNDFKTTWEVEVAKANDLYKEGQFQAAHDLYTKVLTEARDDVLNRGQLSTVLYNRGSARLQLAREDFKKVLDIKPDHEKAKSKLEQTEGNSATASMKLM